MPNHLFDGRDIVITGGTGALGSAVAAGFASAGARCHIPCFRESELEQFPLTDHPGVRIETGMDLTDESGVESYFADLPPIWASVHVAGGFAMSPIARTSADDLMGQFRLNALSAFLCSREAVKKMRAHKGDALGPGLGRIVNVAARPAIEPRLGAGMIAYTMAKAAVGAMTEALAQEVVSDGILVNAVVPAVMDTPANRAAMPDADHDSWATVDDVARTICFLASPDNTVTRGGLIPVCGVS